MTQDTEHPRRLAIAIAVAASAVTVAVGVTLASFLGYLAPRRAPSLPPPALARPQGAPAAPAIVLVPVQPTAPVAPPTPTYTDAFAAADVPRGGRRSHERDEEDGDDD